MKTQRLNLFIIDDDPLVSSRLRNYLDKKFGADISITTFNTSEGALRKIDKNTSIVILDTFLEGKSDNGVFNSIKSINPKVEVIMLTSNEDIEIAIDTYRKGAVGYAVKGENSRKEISSIVYNILTYPIRIMVKEFGISKYLAIFLLAFVFIGTTVFIAMKYIG
jgi:DNA-binding NarL/FixJ family response regulator